MESEKKPRISNVGAWGMNIVSSVGIIMVNKQVMSSSGYGFCFGNSIFILCFLFQFLFRFRSDACLGFHLVDDINRLEKLKIRAIC